MLQIGGLEYMALPMKAQKQQHILIIKKLEPIPPSLVTYRPFSNLDGIIKRSCATPFLYLDSYDVNLPFDDKDNNIRDKLKNIQRRLGNQETIKILDIGCGLGIAALDLLMICLDLGISAKVCGIDIKISEDIVSSFISCSSKEKTPTMLNELKLISDKIKYFKQKGLLQLLPIPVECMPSEWTDNFHLIVSMQTFRYLFDQVMALEETYRVLAPNAEAIIHTNSLRYFPDRYDETIENPCELFDPIRLAAPTLRGYGFKIEGPPYMGCQTFYMRKTPDKPILLTGLIRDPAYRYKPLTITDPVFSALIPPSEQFNPRLFLEIEENPQWKTKAKVRD